jgi:hypothetical protein
MVRNFIILVYHLYVALFIPNDQSENRIMTYIQNSLFMEHDICDCCSF